MALVEFSIEHRQTFAEARERLESVVGELQSRFRGLIPRVEWAPGRDAVLLAGPGVELRIFVDARQIRVEGDIPFLGKLLGNKTVSTVKGLLESKFQQPAQ